MRPRVQTVDLGTMAYAAAFDAQRAAHEQVLAGGPPRVLLVEHPPVITVSRRQGAARHLVADPATLARLGIEVQPTDRGGDITYHGPGQLVAYPILRLNDFGLNLGGYMRLLEQAIIATVATWGVLGQRAAGMTGVWVGDGDAAHAKLAALGVRVRKNVTMHGLALNVTTDLTHFATIVPCGLVGRPVTSLRRLLGEACPAMAEVKATLIGQLQRLLGGPRP